VRIGEPAANARRNLIDFDLTIGLVVLALAAASVRVTRIVIRYEKRIAAIAEQKKRAEARAELSELSDHLRRYYKDFGNFPTTDQGLDFLLGSPEIDAGIFRGPMPEGLALLRDPWGHPFKYESDGDSYILKSLGPTGNGSDSDLTVTAQQ
jgi:hypothetical protein